MVRKLKNIVGFLTFLFIYAMIWISGMWKADEEMNG